MTIGTGAVPNAVPPAIKSVRKSMKRTSPFEKAGLNNYRICSSVSIRVLPRPISVLFSSPSSSGKIYRSNRAVKRAMVHQSRHSIPANSPVAHDIGNDVQIVYASAFTIPNDTD